MSRVVSLQAWLPSQTVLCKQLQFKYYIEVNKQHLNLQPELVPLVAMMSLWLLAGLVVSSPYGLVAGWK